MRLTKVDTNRLNYEHPVEYCPYHDTGVIPLPANLGQLP